MKKAWSPRASVDDLTSRARGVTGAKNAGRWVVTVGFRTQRACLELFVCRCPLAPSRSSVRLSDHSHQLLHRREGCSHSKAGNFHPPSNQDPM